MVKVSFVVAEPHLTLNIIRRQGHKFTPIDTKSNWAKKYFKNPINVNFDPRSGRAEIGESFYFSFYFFNALGLFHVTGL